MPVTKRIGTRELLRNFKPLKELLTSGKVHCVVIDLGNDVELELSVKRPKHTAEELLRYLDNRPTSYRHTRIRRTHIFDTMFRRKP